MMSLSLPLRRAVALSLLAAIVMALYAVCIAPFVSAYSGNAATTAQLEAALQKYRQIAARLPAMTRTLESLQADQSSQQGYLSGANEAVAAATLQDRLKSLVAREGGRLQSTQAMPQPRTEGKPQRVGVRAQMVMRIGELQAVLHRLESTAPVLFIENLGIRAVTTGVTEDDVPLDVTLDVIGYLAEAGQ